MENKKAIFIFLLLGIIWGSNFIYMKLATVYISELQVVFLRVLFGFIPVLIYTIYKKTMRIEHFKYAFHFFIMSLLGASVYYYYFVKASSLLLSGITGALSASVPLFAFILAVIFLKDEKLDKRLFGILLGLIGVVLIAKPYELDVFESNIEGIKAIILGSLVVGSSFVYAKRFISPLKIHFSALTTYQLAFATITLSLFVDYNGISNITLNLNVLLGTIIGLGLLGTGLAFILYYYLIEHLGAVRASSATYLPPIVALLIGFFIVGEDIDLIDLMGTVLILFGVYMINRKV
ncbi:DMT family transporter [Arcobacter arenosus]|uniref:DMT family transporter n=1 Tax=Arcobacter arenosus TaxID=2576037 RepID=UPI001E38FADB|nr:DMT family transporter [Arcobacter arenosus]